MKPQQRLVNILFDEVKLIQAIRLIGGHIIGHASNKPEDNEELATSALVIEIVCHHGGPEYILGVHPVSTLKAVDILQMLSEAVRVIKDNDGFPVSFICDNCPTNQGVYSQLGGLWVFLTYGLVHIFKNLRNNWITEATQRLSLMKNGIEYIACWNDIKKLYNEDRQTSLRLTKLTHTAVYTKPLQCQSVPLVRQVFNEKTIAALSTLQAKLNISRNHCIC